MRIEDCDMICDFCIGIFPGRTFVEISLHIVIVWIILAYQSNIAWQLPLAFRNLFYLY